MLKEEAAMLKSEGNSDLMSVESDQISPQNSAQTKIVKPQQIPIEGKIEVGKSKKAKKGSPDYCETDKIKFGIKEAGKSAQGRIGGYMQLNTIEEERHETQTSHYFEGQSERDDSRLMGSNNLRNSQHAGGFDIDDELKKSGSKMVNDYFLNKSLSKDEKPAMSTRSKEDNVIETESKKKFSQSVADASLRNFRTSVQNNEVFDNTSEASSNSSPPPKVFVHKHPKDKDDSTVNAN